MASYIRSVDERMQLAESPTPGMYMALAGIQSVHSDIRIALDGAHGGYTAPHVITLRTFICTASDDVEISEDAGRYAAFKTSISDTIDISDARMAALGHLRSISETIEINRTSISTMESGESWVGGTVESTIVHTGSQSRKLSVTSLSTSDTMTHTLAAPLDLSDIERLSVWAYVVRTSKGAPLPVSNVNIYLVLTDGSANTRRYDLGRTSGTVKWLRFSAAVGAWTTSDSGFDLSDIVTAYYEISAYVGDDDVDVYLDDAIASDEVALARGLGRSVSDAVEISENASRSAEFVRPVSDDVEITENASRNASFVRPVSDIEDISENSSRNASFVRPVSDSVDISEVAVRNASFKLVANLDIQITDSNGTVAGYIRTASDPLDISEGVQPVAIYVRSDGSTVAISETTTPLAVFSGVYVRVVNDTVEISTSMSRGFIVSLNQAVEVTTGIVQASGWFTFETQEERDEWAAGTLGRNGGIGNSEGYDLSFPNPIHTGAQVGVLSVGRPGQDVYNQVFDRAFAVPKNWYGFQKFTYWVYPDTNLVPVNRERSSVRVILTSTTGALMTSEWIPYMDTDDQVTYPFQEWWMITITKEQFTESAGTFDWGSVTLMEFELKRTVGTQDGNAIHYHWFDDGLVYVTQSHALARKFDGRANILAYTDIPPDVSPEFFKLSTGVMKEGTKHGPGYLQSAPSYAWTTLPFGSFEESDAGWVPYPWTGGSRISSIETVHGSYIFETDNAGQTSVTATYGGLLSPDPAHRSPVQVDITDYEVMSLWFRDDTNADSVFTIIQDGVPNAGATAFGSMLRVGGIPFAANVWQEYRIEFADLTGISGLNRASISQLVFIRIPSAAVPYQWDNFRIGKPQGDVIIPISPGSCPIEIFETGLPGASVTAVIDVLVATDTAPADDPGNVGGRGGGAHPSDPYKEGEQARRPRESVE